MPMSRPLDLPDQAPLPLDQPATLLGGLTPAQFMKRYWQKKPLLVRQAMPGVRPPVDRATLLGMAERDDVESRLIVQQGQTAGRKRQTPGQTPWQLKHGPIARRSLPALSQARWTLLVQSLDLHVPQAHDMLQPFRFIPDARLDDLMMSFATDGGGVGPHYDSYDVFLIQVHGRRRWRIGRLNDATLVPDVPLKILHHFEPEQEWVLEPGDMLYLPPQWAHDGIAEGECMTCSVGFRAPERSGLAAEMLLRVAEAVDDTGRTLYRDPSQPATVQPASIPAALQTFAQEAVQRVLQTPHALHTALGEIMTEPKPKVWFESSNGLIPGRGVRLDPRTRMLYDDRSIYVNGESWRASAHQGRLLRLLADQRWLSAQAVSKASPDVLELLEQWAEDGWLQPDTPE
jgi:50S ribosomal protein L16 3-hydroxylase